MNYHPLVTVMIPTYNQHKSIKRTINSVLKQTYSNIEIIISDDSTNEKTKYIIENEYLKKNKHKNIYYIHHNPPLGRSKNYKYLLYEKANGEWVINLDGDDYFEDPTFIEKAIKAINKTPDVAFVFAKQIILKLSDNNRIYNTNDYDEVIDGNWLFVNSVFKNIDIPHLATLYNRKKALEIGFYNENNISTDRESLLKLSINNKVLFLNLNAGCWVHHNDNASQNMNFTDVIENLKMYDRLYMFASEHTNMNKFYLFVWKKIAQYKGIYGYIVAHNKIKIKKILLELIKIDPILFFFTLIDFRIHKKMFCNKLGRNHD